MIVILPEGAYGKWPTAPADATQLFLLPFPADRLVADLSLSRQHHLRPGLPGSCLRQ